jgi:RNA polymerase sigma-70 factor (ECF subfamily)
MDLLSSLDERRGIAALVGRGRDRRASLLSGRKVLAMTRFDDERWEVLYRTYYGRLRAVAVRMFGDRLADDVAGETLLRALTRLDSLDLDRDLWPWLVVVARNVGRDLRRADRRLQPLDAAPPEDLVGVADEPAEHAIRREDAATVHSVLARLSTAHHQVLRMRYFEERSVAEIADLLGVSYGACCQQLLRARREFALEHHRLRQARRAPAAMLRSRRHLRCTGRTKR